MVLSVESLPAYPTPLGAEEKAKAIAMAREKSPVYREFYQTHGEEGVDLQVVASLYADPRHPLYRHRMAVVRLRPKADLTRLTTIPVAAGPDPLVAIMEGTVPDRANGSVAAFSARVGKDLATESQPGLRRRPTEQIRELDTRLAAEPLDLVGMNLEQLRDPSGTSLARRRYSVARDRQLAQLVLEAGFVVGLDARRDIGGAVRRSAGPSRRR